MNSGMNAAGSGHERRASRWLLLAFAAIAFGLPAFATPAWSLSEIKREQAPAPKGEEAVEQEPLPPVDGVPLPDPIQNTPRADEPTPDDQTEPGEATPDNANPEGTPGDNSARHTVDPGAPLPEVVYDLQKLPEPVRRMRQLIVDAAQKGDIEALRPLIGSGESITQLSLGGLEGDPVEFLRELSGDKEGQEILAILEEVLNAGYVHLDAGTPNELYVWPYFFAIPLDKLDARQRVELFKIVTAGDYEDMKTYGAYIFYRVGITPDGRWSFFVAGD
ncbi:hypothetical protein SAMN04488498_108217 [Mesorhizobium albiziae]|uniref:Fibronectin attachment protein n=2 Tax=Neomesorhizobium albiziae TaxID=335020 RepID=A0A1I4ASR4_9HYPH|nr:hypothetical protein SAMN04488498_108217 [Mesorhizobium albiziae]